MSGFLFSINPTTGEFEDVGDALVSADGRLVETISGGIRNSSWHTIPAPPPKPKPPKDNPRNPDDDCDECPESSPTNGDGGSGGSGGSGGDNGSSGGSGRGKSSGPSQPTPIFGPVVPLGPPDIFIPTMWADPPPMSPPSLFGTPPRQKVLPKELETEVGNHSGAVVGSRSLSTYVVRDQALGVSLSYEPIRGRLCTSVLTTLPPTRL